MHLEPAWSHFLFVLSNFSEILQSVKILQKQMQLHCKCEENIKLLMYLQVTAVLHPLPVSVHTILPLFLVIESCLCIPSRHTVSSPYWRIFVQRDLCHNVSCKHYVFGELWLKITKFQMRKLHKHCCTLFSRQLYFRINYNLVAQIKLLHGRFPLSVFFFNLLIVASFISQSKKVVPKSSLKGLKY